MNAGLFAELSIIANTPDTHVPAKPLGSVGFIYTLQLSFMKIKSILLATLRYGRYEVCKLCSVYGK
jgi:hypothetical protein